MPQELSTEDLCTSSLRILAKMMAKAILQKSLTGKEPSKIELRLPGMLSKDGSVPGEKKKKRSRL